MQNLRELQTTALVDLLAIHTNRYTKLLAEKRFDDDYESSKNLVKEIQEILLEREVSGADDRTATDPLTSSANTV